MNRPFLSFLLAFLPAIADERPNIVFLLADDQRNDTLGCAGHPIIQTPVIDSLAARGMRFTNAFVTTSICAASRASIFTGLTERTHGYTFGEPPVPERFAQTSYPSLMRRAGYRTGFFGKYGVRMAVEKESLFNDVLAMDRPYKRPDGHVDELCLERALEFLDDCDADHPFCLSISFNSGHAEDKDKTAGQEGHFPVIPAMRDKYANIDIPPPRLAKPAFFDSQPDFLKQSMNRERYHWRWDTPAKYQANMRAYFALLSGIDQMTGRVLAKLDDLGFTDNTIILYAGDNGYYMGDRGFAGKWSHYEQSLRIPLIIHDPRQPKQCQGTQSQSMALNIDLPATMLDCAGIEVPRHYQGRSLVPLLGGESPTDWRSDFFCEHLMDNEKIPKWEGLRGNRYVYARYFEQDPPYEFLHDLKEDPDQATNLAGDPRQRDTLERFRARCKSLRDDFLEERDR